MSKFAKTCCTFRGRPICLEIPEEFPAYKVEKLQQNFEKWMAREQEEKLQLQERSRTLRLLELEKLLHIVDFPSELEKQK